MPFVSSPLSVAHSPSGKKRLVIDLRHVNTFLWKQKFKYEDIRAALQIMRQGDYIMVTFDLKSGYHHVDIHPTHWKYLGFACRYETGLKYFEFRVLSFGLSSTCYAFSKLLRPLVRKWRSMGLKVILYLDDGICFAKSEEASSKASQLLQADLHAAGLVINCEKFNLIPTQLGRWLGYEIDLAAGSLRIPENRCERLTKDIEALLASSYSLVPVRKLASVVGQLISMTLVTGGIARLMTRAAYRLIDSRRAWGDSVVMNEEVKKELRFWLKKPC